ENRSEAFDLHPLALELARPADGFRLLAHATLRRLLVGPVALHLAPDPFPLHLLFQRLERAVDIVVANEYLHVSGNPFPVCMIERARTPVREPLTGRQNSTGIETS